MKVKNIVSAVALAGLVGTGSAAFVEANVESRQPVEVKTEAVKGKAVSLLPPNKGWKLVWNDEFDQREIDRTKWMCRESFWARTSPRSRTTSRACR